jgi:acetolactate synthase-1/2/3 large subunit
MDALLARSSRPAIIAGIGALRSQAQDAVTELAHRWHAPVAVTPKGKGLIPEDDPLFAGVIEMAGNDIVIGFLQRSDLILAAGLDVVEMDKPWLLSAPVIHLDTVPNEEGYYPTEVELCGNVRILLKQIGERVSRKGVWTDEELIQHRANLRDYVCPSSPRLQPYQVVETFREAMGREAMATCDVGANKFLVGQVWKTYRAGTFMMSNGLSSMGYSLPTAATMKLLNPQRQVVAFVGDGGLAMYLGELETLTRLSVGLLIVVLVDNSLELIRRSQERRGYAEIGTTFTNPDFGLLARSFGLAYYHVASVDECRRAAEEVARGRTAQPSSPPRLMDTIIVCEIRCRCPYPARAWSQPGFESTMVPIGLGLEISYYRQERWHPASPPTRRPQWQPRYVGSVLWAAD